MTAQVPADGTLRCPWRRRLPRRTDPSISDLVERLRDPPTLKLRRTTFARMRCSRGQACERRLVRKGDSNPHGIATASPSSWPICCAGADCRASCGRMVSRSVLQRTHATTLFAQIRTRIAAGSTGDCGGWTEKHLARQNLEPAEISVEFAHRRTPSRHHGPASGVAGWRRRRAVRV